MCGDCAFRRQVGLDQVDFGVHPVEQRELFLDLPCFALWPTADFVYSCSICISLAGSRRQLSIRKNERKGGSDEPDAPLLLEREPAVGEVDVVIGEKRAIRPTTLPTDGKNPASSRALPSNPCRHLGSGASRSRESLSTLSSPHPFPSTCVRLGPCLKSERRLLCESEALVLNLDKWGYASDLTSIEALPQAEARHQLLKVDLTDAAATAAALQQADPDLVLHLAAESHVVRSIEGPGACRLCSPTAATTTAPGNSPRS